MDENTCTASTTGPNVVKGMSLCYYTKERSVYFPDISGKNAV